MAQVRGLWAAAADSPHGRARADLRSYGVAAAWRLGQWGDVDAYLPSGAGAGVDLSLRGCAKPSLWVC